MTAIILKILRERVSDISLNSEFHTKNNNINNIVLVKKAKFGKPRTIFFFHVTDKNILIYFIIFSMSRIIQLVRSEA